MKKVSVLAVLVLGVVFVLSACAPVAGAMQRVVDLPNTVEADVTALILVAVSWIFAQLIVLVPFLKFLDEFKTPLALAISAQLIGLIETAVPDAYGAVVILGIQLVLAVVASFLAAHRLQQKGVLGFKSFR